MVATVGVVAILMSIAVLGLSRRFVDLESAHQELTNTVRQLRLRSTIQGAHYRLTGMTDSYEVRRLEDSDGDGLWVPDSGVSAQTVELPPGVTIEVAKISGATTPIEFDTRGVAVDPLGAEAEVIRITLTDAAARTRTVEVWPSGQVHGEPIAMVVP